MSALSAPVSPGNGRTPRALRRIKAFSNLLIFEGGLPPSLSSLRDADAYMNMRQVSHRQVTVVDGILQRSDVLSMPVREPYLLSLTKSKPPKKGKPPTSVITRIIEAMKPKTQIKSSSPLDAIPISQNPPNMLAHPREYEPYRPPVVSSDFSARVEKRVPGGKYPEKRARSTSLNSALISHPTQVPKITGAAPQPLVFITDRHPLECVICEEYHRLRVKQLGGGQVKREKKDCMSPEWQLEYNEGRIACLEIELSRLREQVQELEKLESGNLVRLKESLDKIQVFEDGIQDTGEIQSPPSEAHERRVYRDNCQSGVSDPVLCYWETQTKPTVVESPAGTIGANLQPEEAKHVQILCKSPQVGPQLMQSSCQNGLESSQEGLGNFQSQRAECQGVAMDCIVMMPRTELRNSNFQSQGQIEQLHADTISVPKPAAELKNVSIEIEREWADFTHSRTLFRFGSPRIQAVSAVHRLRIFTLESGLSNDESYLLPALNSWEWSSVPDLGLCNPSDSH